MRHGLTRSLTTFWGVSWPWTANVNPVTAHNSTTETRSSHWSLLYVWLWFNHLLCIAEGVVPCVSAKVFYPSNISTTSCISSIPFCTKQVTVEQGSCKHVTMTVVASMPSSNDFIWAKCQQNYQLQTGEEKETWWLKHNNLWAYSLRWYGYLSSNNHCNYHCQWKWFYLEFM